MSNIFRRLLSAALNRPLGQSPIPIGQMPVYPAANTLTFVKAYQDNSTVFTIVDLMARKFAFIPRYLYKVEQDKSTDQDKRERKAAQRKYQAQIRMKNPNLSAKKLQDLHFKAYQDDVVENSPLSILLDRPNENMGQDSYYALIYAFKKLTGNAYVWLNRGDNDNVIGPARLKLPIFEMQPLPSQFMTINVDRKYQFGLITGYTYYEAGQPIYIPKEDIIHWKSANPYFDSYNYTHLYGLSPLQPGLKLIVQDDAARDAAVAMFQNGGARGILYNETMDNLNPEQITAADNAINTKINNRAMKSAVAMLPGKWGYAQMGDSAVDMEFVDAQDRTFQRICNLLGCNPQIFETKTTFNNVEQARKDLITNAILPDCASFRDEENRILLQAFGLTKSSYCIDVDVTDLPELQDDMEKLTARVMSTWPLTPNQKLQELGYDESKDPDMDLVFIPTTFTLLEDAAVPTSSLNPDSGFGADTGNISDAVSNPSNGQSSNGNKKNLSAREVDAAWRKAGV